MGEVSSSWVSTLPILGGHEPCQCGYITFLICHRTTWSCVTWLCGWGTLILSHHTAKFGIHGPYGSRDNGICNISCNSNSNSNADVPMPRFTSGRYWLVMELIKVPVLLPSGCFISLLFHSPCFICNVSNCDQRDHTSDFFEELTLSS